MKNCIVLDFFDHFFGAIGIKKLHYQKSSFPDDVPVENLGTLAFGIMVHLGPALLLGVFVSIMNFSLWGLGVAFITVSMLTLSVIRWFEKKYPSVSLKSPSAREIFKGVSLVFITATVFGTLFICSGFWILSHIPITRWHHGNWSSVLIALFLTDFSFYWIHRSLNHGNNKNFIHKWYRRNHAHHHRVKALDFYRGNLSSFFDIAITAFQIPLIVISTILGMNLESVLTTYCLLLILQSTHHANHTFHIGFLRYIFVDNHSHKFHHCPRGNGVNFGGIFSVWDIFFRTYYEEWNLSASYMSKHKVPLPFRRLNINR